MELEVLQSVKIKSQDLHGSFKSMQTISASWNSTTRRPHEQRCTRISWPNGLLGNSRRWESQIKRKSLTPLASESHCRSSCRPSKASPTSSRPKKSLKRAGWVARRANETHASFPSDPAGTPSASKCSTSMRRKPLPTQHVPLNPLSLGVVSDSSPARVAAAQQ